MKFAAALLLLSAPLAAAQTCETAWAFDGTSYSSTGTGQNKVVDHGSQCFNPDVQRWGWFLDSVDVGAAQSYPVWAASGQCDRSKGWSAGSVEVGVNSNGECFANWSADGSNTYIKEFHFNCACDSVVGVNMRVIGVVTPESQPGLFDHGVEPGQMDVKLDGSSGFVPTTSWSDSVAAPTGGWGCGGNLFAMVHVVACQGGAPTDAPVAPTEAPVAPTEAPVAPTEAPIVRPPTSGVEGDPHFKSWTGKWFDYMGACDLKFMEAPKFDGHQDMKIHIRTKLIYQYSYVEAAAIQIGDDVLEVAGYGDYAVNGVDTPYLGGKAGRIGGYDLFHNEVSKKKATYDIVLGPNENITLASYKNLVSVQINIQNPEKYFSASEGMIGSLSGDLLSRSGKIMDPEADEVAFGQEWQITPEDGMIFRSPRAPQYPSKCEMATKSASTGRRLGESIAEEAANKACAHKTGAEFNNCVYDVMAIGDLELANMGVY